MLMYALKECKHLIDDGGLVCEFGVSTGRSLRMIAEMLPSDVRIYGFDTFTGLPQAWGNEPQGTYSTGGVVPYIAPNVDLEVGLFADTIPKFLGAKEHKKDFLAFCNIDCDLYSSTRDVLENIQPRVVEGTILIFDEYIAHPGWRRDEFRAFRESCKRFGWTYEYLGFSLGSKQAIVRILKC